MVKGEMNLFQQDMDSLYSLGDEPEKYLASVVLFEQWCEQQSGRTDSLGSSDGIA